MAHTGQEIDGPGGLRLRLVRTGDETDGELLEMEAAYGGTGQFPPRAPPSAPGRALRGAGRRDPSNRGRRGAPISRRRDLRRTGRDAASDDGRRAFAAALGGPARPRTAEFFERLYGDGPDSAQAAESFEAFMAEFSAEVRLTGS